MKTLKEFILKHSILFAVIFPIIWFITGIVFAGISSSLFNISFQEGLPVTIGRICVTIILLILIWKMDWLRATGLLHPGGWQVWLATLIALIYFCSAGLYSFYNQISFDFSILFNNSKARSLILSNFTAAFGEEILYRGIILYVLTRWWENRSRGLIASAALTSVLFALIHFTQVLTSGISISASLLQLFETTLIGFWWSAFVLKWKSLWPAIITHFIINLTLSVQGLSASLIEPNILAYIRLTLFSIIPGAVGIWLILKMKPKL